MEVKEEIFSFNCNVRRSQREKRSIAWDGFIPSADGTSAVCKICDVRVKTKNGTTTGMKAHLEKVHVVNYGLVKELAPEAKKVKVKPKVRKVSNLNLNRPRPKQTRQRRSIAWKYFTLEPGGISAVCKLCSKSLKVTAGGTTALLSHIQSYHKTLTENEEIFLQKLKTEPESGSEGERKPEINVKVQIKRKVKRNYVPSVAWKYFNRATDNVTAECKICGKVMKTGNGVTSGLRNHLRALHRDQVKHERTLFPTASENPNSSTLVKRGLKRVRRLTSPAWKWFRPDPSWKFATCKLCEKNIKTLKGATTGLTQHVIAYHSTAIRSRGKRPANNDRDQEGVSKKAKSDCDPNHDPDLDHSFEPFQDTEHEPSESKDRSNRNSRAVRSIAWKYFNRAADKSTAQCKMCGTVIKTPNGVTTGLRYHLKAFHRDQVKRERTLFNKRRSLNLPISNSSFFQRRSSWGVKRGLKGGVRRLTSAAWNWFHPDPSWKFATCKLCGKNIKTIHGATTGLMKHVIAFHIEAIKTSRNKGQPNCLEEEYVKTSNDDPDSDPGLDDDETEAFDFEDIEAEPSADAAPLSHCFMCHSTINDRANDSHPSTSSSSSSISKQLHVIFLLSNILQIPRETLEGFLEKFGNPQDWVKLCNFCDARLYGATKIYQELLQASKQFRDVRMSMIKEVRNRDRFPLDRSSGAGDASSIITGNCWNYIKSCDYGHFTDPFIAGDLEASEKLKRRVFQVNSKLGSP